MVGELGMPDREGVLEGTGLPEGLRDAVGAAVGRDAVGAAVGLDDDGVEAVSPSHPNVASADARYRVRSSPLDTTTVAFVAFVAAAALPPPASAAHAATGRGARQFPRAPAPSKPTASTRPSSRARCAPRARGPAKTAAYVAAAPVALRVAMGVGTATTSSSTAPRPSWPCTFSPQASGRPFDRRR